MFNSQICQNHATDCSNCNSTMVLRCGRLCLRARRSGCAVRAAYVVRGGKFLLHNRVAKMVSSCHSFQDTEGYLLNQDYLPRPRQTVGKNYKDDCSFLFIATTASCVSILFNNHASIPLFPTGSFAVTIICLYTWPCGRR